LVVVGQAFLPAKRRCQIERRRIVVGAFAKASLDSLALILDEHPHIRLTVCYNRDFGDYYATLHESAVVVLE
jgi:hypothetical protein